MLKCSNERCGESAYTQHHSVQPLHARHSLRSCHPGQASRNLYRSAALLCETPTPQAHDQLTQAYSRSGQQRAAAMALIPLRKKIRSRRPAAAAIFFPSGLRPIFLIVQLLAQRSVRHRTKPVFVWWGHAMYTPTRIAEREAVFEFLRQKLRAYQIIFKDIRLPLVVLSLPRTYNLRREQTVMFGHAASIMPQCPKWEKATTGPLKGTVRVRHSESREVNMR